MTSWVYVDNSNVFIEGKRLSAIKLGLAANLAEANSQNIFDSKYRMCFGKLNDFVTGHARGEMRARLFGSRPPANDMIWNIATRNGFEVTVYDRNAGNKEKKLDTGIVAMMVRDACKNAQAGDTFTIVSGDVDYVPAVEMVRGEGFDVNVVFWEHAGRELKSSASSFISLDPHLDALRLR